MKKILLAIGITLALAGCGPNDPQIVRTNNYIVVTPPAELYACPIVKVPDTNHLSNVDVARFILKEYKNNVSCYNNIMAIKKYMDRAKAIYNQ